MGGGERGGGGLTTVGVPPKGLASCVFGCIQGRVTGLRIKTCVSGAASAPTSLPDSPAVDTRVRVCVCEN